MPKILELIGHENGVEIKSKLIASSAYSLGNHLDNGSIVNELSSEHWDYVVLGQKSKGNKIQKMIDGNFVLGENELYYSEIEESVGIIRKFNAEPILLALYSKINASYNDSLLNYMNNYISKELNIKLAPISSVWKTISNIKNSKLYQKDNIHPSLLGSYIIASTVFSTIFNKTPNMQNFNFSNVDLKSNYKFHNATSENFNISKKKITEVSNAISSEFLTINSIIQKQEKPYLDERIPYLNTSKEQFICNSDLIGLWEGSTNFYSDILKSKSLIKLSISENSNNRLDISLSIIFENTDIPFHVKTSKITIIGNEISFLDKTGINNDPISYRGIYNKSNISGLMSINGSRLNGWAKFSIEKTND